MFTGEMVKDHHYLLLATCEVLGLFMGSLGSAVVIMLNLLLNFPGGREESESVTNAGCSVSLLYTSILRMTGKE